MNKLDELRLQIDKVDEEITTLFEKRLDIIQKVIEYKIENNLPILDSEREEKMLKNNLNKIKNEEYRQYYKIILEGFLTASKKMQSDISNKKK